MRVDVGERERRGGKDQQEAVLVEIGSSVEGLTCLPINTAHSAILCDLSFGLASAPQCSRDALSKTCSFYIRLSLVLLAAL